MTNTLLPVSFPQRVHNVLKICEEQGREDIISWVNNGTAFRVNNLQAFERELLPQYFNTKKYYSFTRALYAYGFTCVRAGRQPGIYSHPRFNRNDPLSPSLMRRVTRKERKKLTAPNHVISNPTFVEAMNNRPSSRNPGKLNGHQSLQHPVLPDETRSLDENGNAAVFGRQYHTIASQGADRVASLPVQILPGSDLSGMFDSEGRNANTRSHRILSTSTSTTDPTSFQAMVRSSNGTSNDRQCERIPIAPNGGSLFILGSGRMAPIMESSHGARNGSEQEVKGSLVWRHVPDRHSRSQEQDDVGRIPLNLQPTRATGYPNSHSSIPSLPSLLESTKGYPRSDDPTAELGSFLGSLAPFL